MARHYATKLLPLSNQTKLTLTLTLTLTDTVTPTLTLTLILTLTLSLLQSCRYIIPLYNGPLMYCVRRPHLPKICSRSDPPLQKTPNSTNFV